MHIGLLGNANSWYVADLRRAVEAGGHRCCRIDFHRLTAHISGDRATQLSEFPRPYDVDAGPVDCNQLDAIIVRTMPPGSLEQVVLRMDALQSLVEAGVTVINSPRSIECAVDKFLTTSKLAAAGLPVPETIVCEHDEAAMQAFEQLGSDVVVKPLFGAEGRGMVRVCSVDIALRVFRTLSRIDAVLYLQRYIEHEGFDLRLLLWEGEVVAAMKRRSTGDFRTNVAQQGQAEVFTPTDEQRDLARCAALATGTAFAGVDLLYDRSGQCYVLEVNAVPGWRALTRVTGIDIAARLIHEIESMRREPE